MWVSNKYNSFGEVIESIRNSSSETYTYDNEGRIISHIVKDKDMGEVKTSYTYDVLGRTTSITTGAGTENITYDDAGRISVKSLPSQGTEKRYSYYKNGLLKSVLTYRNGQLTNTENSEYDLSGNKTLEETDGNIKRYAYDGLNRLKSVIEHNGDQTEYEFDSFGNISKEYTLTPGDIKTKYYHYDNANRLILMYDDKTSAEYTYDAEGNMITKVSDAGGSVSTSNYVYDGYNRLSEFYSQNTEAQYFYNPEGLRESKTVNGNATRFLYDNGNIIGEFTGDDYYIYHRGTELIGYTSFSGKSATYQQNNHGNVTALLDYDGSELKTYTYNAYGKEQAFTANPEGNQTILYQWKNETDSTYNPFRYCGEYVDAETGLIYLRNRYYDPSVGRFITEDPVRDGKNWYVYCNGNPIMFVDPSGLIVTAWDRAHCTPGEIKKLQEATIQWEQGKLFRNQRMMNDAHRIAENIRNKYRENGEYGSSDGNTGKNGAMYHSDIYYENQTISASKYTVPILNFSVNYGVGAQANINLNGIKAVVGGKMYYDFTNVASNNPTQSLSFAAEVMATDKFSIGGSYTATIDPITKQNLINQGYVGIKLGNQTFGFDSLPHKKDFVLEIGGGLYVGVGGDVTVNINMSELFRRLFK